MYTRAADCRRISPSDWTNCLSECYSTWKAGCFAETGLSDEPLDLARAEDGSELSKVLRRNRKDRIRLGRAVKKGSEQKMWDGTLSGEEFQHAAKEFLKIWNNHSSSTFQWSWQECPYSSAGGYLILEDVVLNFIDEEVDGDEEEDGIEEEDSNNFPDAATLVSTDSSGQSSRCTYHVMYNESYRVPSVFFRGYYPDGRPINWFEVGLSLSAEFAQRIDENKWTFLTQEEHPYLHLPWYMLHPCGTSGIMALIFSQRMITIGKDKLEDENHHLSSHKNSGVNDKAFSADRSRRQPANPKDHYLLTWLSFVGPLLRLPVHLDLFRSLLD
ncbi:hypothetical protein R1flu_021610 [Riccia fluitans]|uniref:Ubiquitin-like-conjugating enzyme ATG10 n=1 Tax=Riccia fluitans TaxID=41844 RepID=A0ABD1ZR27_9MARC